MRNFYLRVVDNQNDQGKESLIFSFNLTLLALTTDMQDSTIIEVLTEEKPLAQLKFKKYVLNNWQRPTSYKPGQSEGLLLSKGMCQQNVNE